MQIYGISFMDPYKQSGRWKYVFGKEYHKTACINLLEDENLDVRNMSRT